MHTGLFLHVCQDVLVLNIQSIDTILVCETFNLDARLQCDRKDTVVGRR